MKLIELTKVCNNCGKRKEISAFNKQKGGCFGIRAVCKICMMAYHKARRTADPGKIRAYFKARYAANQEKVRAQARALYAAANQEMARARQKTWRDTNPEKIRAQTKAYRAVNSEKINTQARDRRAADPEKMRAKERAYRIDNPEYMLNSCMRSGIGKSLKHGESKSCRHWETLVPYTLDDLIEHLKETLPYGYTWGDYISGKSDLNIDHIIPVSVHNFKSHTDTDFARCWALENLQLLPARENMSKGSRLTEPFQPSLLL